ncbi:hypothetical protein KP509_15G051800 [Ceratopteris richardii]|nr:hypothetical protein KP509_15G051800 [Ceratopteris richardii]
MYMKCGSVIEAQEVFDRLPFLDVVSWTALMIGYADNGLNKEVLRYLDHMNRKCIAPNELTYTCSLHACAMTGNIGKGFELHNDIVKKGFDIEIPVGDYVVKLYSKCGFLFDAENVFERLMQKDVSTWNSLLTGYSEHGFADETFGQFQKMQIQGISPDIVSWNSLIMSFAEQRSMLSTVNLLLQMQEQGLLPNSMTFATILRSCSDAAALMHGRRVHAQICKSDIIDTVDTNMMTDLFNMYGRCGNMYDANLVFDEFGVRDLISWNALITGYAHQGDIDTVFLLFRRMQDSAQPNSTTFLNVLNACNHMGHLQEAYQYLELMRDGYDLIPSIRHFNCILDLHGRTSNLHNMGVVLEHMPYQPDLPVWNSVANAIATLSASNF